MKSPIQTFKSNTNRQLEVASPIVTLHHLSSQRHFLIAALQFPVAGLPVGRKDEVKQLYLSVMQEDSCPM